MWLTSSGWQRHKELKMAEKRWEEMMGTDGQRKADTLTQVKWMFLYRLLGKTGSMRGSNISKYLVFLIIFLFTVLCQILGGTTDFVLISSGTTHCRALSRTSPLSPGLTGVGGVDKARSALGRRKEHSALLCGHHLTSTLTSYMDIPFLAAGDRRQAEGHLRTGKIGNANICKKKSSQK